jgi:branched-chain amino acid transport system ATP-binding protein
MALLEVQDLSIHFGGVKAVQNVSFSIDAGIVYAVIGPNGAGKTTLFNLITGIYPPTAGSILLDGQTSRPMCWRSAAWRAHFRTYKFA